MARRQIEATLLDILIDGFEKNEVLYNHHSRELPMPDEDSAARKFDELADEARRWRGSPIQFDVSARRIAKWDDLEIRQAGRGILVRALTPRFSTWWHEEATWQHQPLDAVFAWLDEESRRS